MYHFFCFNNLHLLLGVQLLPPKSLYVLNNSFPVILYGRGTYLLFCSKNNYELPMFKNCSQKDVDLRRMKSNRDLEYYMRNFTIYTDHLVLLAV
jgi:hypothetical protein